MKKTALKTGKEYFLTDVFRKAMYSYESLNGSVVFLIDGRPVIVLESEFDKLIEIPKSPEHLAEQLGYIEDDFQWCANHKGELKSILEFKMWFEIIALGVEEAFKKFCDGK